MRLIDTLSWPFHRISNPQDQARCDIKRQMRARNNSNLIFTWKKCIKTYFQRYFEQINGIKKFKNKVFYLPTMQMNPLRTLGVSLSSSLYPRASWTGMKTLSVNSVEIDNKDESAEDMTEAETAPKPK